MCNSYMRPIALAKSGKACARSINFIVPFAGKCRLKFAHIGIRALLKVAKLALVLTL